MRNYRESKGNGRSKQKKSRFPQIVSVLIVGTLAITAFFRGNISHIMLVIFWASCSISRLIKYIRSKRKTKAYNIKSYGRYRHSGQKSSYGSHINYRRNPYGNSRFRYYMKKQRSRRNYRNGQDEIV